MKKVIPLVSDRHKPARVVEQIKGEVRKYLKRERKKSLPDDFDYWGDAEFDLNAFSRIEFNIWIPELEASRHDSSSDW